MNEQNQITNQKRGRATVEITYPEGEFTVEQAYEFNKRILSKVAIQQKINQLLLSDKIVPSGTVRISKVGRPRQKYILKKV